VPSTVVKLTLTACLLGFDRSTLNTKFVVPLFPSGMAHVADRDRGERIVIIDHEHRLARKTAALAA